MIDVGIIVASSLYNVPLRIMLLLLSMVKRGQCYYGIWNVVGNTTGGIIGSIMHEIRHDCT